MRTAGLYNKLLNDFGEPELLDDIVDHWSAGPHSDEKGPLLARLRALAAERRLRVSLVSGDVHQCAFAFMTSSPEASAAASDPGFIPQARLFPSSAAARWVSVPIA